ncbi:sulfite exporter TauE/SafE family protein [Litoribacillus peritrichatus]
MEYFFPDAISGLPLLCLLAASFVGSLITASLGVGGGAFLIIVMAEFITPVVLIPLHGLVQFASNGSRAWLTRIHIDRSLVVAFFIGAFLAALIGLTGIRALPEDAISWAVAIFILYSCWGKLPSAGFSESKTGRVLGGFLTTLATLFAGATGPLVASWLRTPNIDRFYYTANFSSCMTLQHALKVIVFSFAGFSFYEWAGVLVLMVLAGLVGTKLGLKLLGRLPEETFKTAFKWLLTLLAVRLIYKLV